MCISNNCDECKPKICGCEGKELSCKCVTYEGDTLPNTGIVAGDNDCLAKAKIDAAIGELIQKTEEASDTLIEIALGASVPTNTPTNNDPVVYHRNNGEIYSWDGTIWKLIGEEREVEKGIGTPTSTPTINQPYIYVNQLGSVYYWDATNAVWILNVNPIFTASGVQGAGTNLSPIKENFDALPIETTVTNTEYVIVSTLANPDGAKVLRTDLGVSITSNDGVFLAPGLKNVKIQVTPTPTKSSTFTIRPEFTNETSVVLTSFTPGVSTNTPSSFTRYTRNWDGLVHLNGTIRFTPPSLNFGITSQITLFNLPAPPFTQVFPLIMTISSGIALPAGGRHFNCLLTILTTGAASLTVLKPCCEATLATLAETEGGINGYTEGFVWVSSIKYYTS